MSPAGNNTSVLTSEIFQLFSCCALKGSSTDSSQPSKQRGRGKRIDISMISNPTDFRHTAHLGSHDLNSDTSVFELQAQMASKGG